VHLFFWLAAGSRIRLSSHSHVPFSSRTMSLLEHHGGNIYYCTAKMILVWESLFHALFCRAGFTTSEPPSLSPICHLKISCSPKNLRLGAPFLRSESPSMWGTMRKGREQKISTAGLTTEKEGSTKYWRRRKIITRHSYVEITHSSRVWKAHDMAKTVRGKVSKCRTSRQQASAARTAYWHKFQCLYDDAHA